MYRSKSVILARMAQSKSAGRPLEEPPAAIKMLFRDWLIPLLGFVVVTTDQRRIAVSGFVEGYFTCGFRLALRREVCKRKPLGANQAPRNARRNV